MCFFKKKVIMKGCAVSRPRRRRWSSGAAGLLYPLLGACLWAAVVGYKPVIIVHGLFDSSADFKNLLGFINEVSGRDKEELFSVVVLLICMVYKHCIIQELTYTVYCRPYSLYNFMFSAKRGPALCNMYSVCIVSLKIVL